MTQICKKCGAGLSCDEIGLYKKLVNRGAAEFTCIKCTAEHFSITVAQCEQLIKQFRDTGCTLFSESRDK